MGTPQTVHYNHRRRCSGIFFVLFVSNFLVHLSECQGNLDTEIVLKPHVTRETDTFYKTELYEPNNVTGSVVPWEDVLKHTAFLTLSENQENSVNFNDEARLHLEEALRSATLKNFDSRPVPQFGDIVMLAMGTLEKNIEDNTYTFLRSQNICNEDDQIDISCLRKMPTNVTALWSVQKVRHRNDKGIYRFELRFGIITMNPNRRIRRDNPELPLKQYVAKQEDYPWLFNGQFSDSDLKKRSDFFEDAQPSISHEVMTSVNGDSSASSSSPSSPAPKSDSRGPFAPSIDRTIFDLLPFFGDDDESFKSPPPAHRYHPAASSSYYTSPFAASPASAQRPAMSARPVASSSDYYNYYAPHPQMSAAPYRPRRPHHPAYSNPFSPPSLLSLLNPLASSTNVRPMSYKPHPQSIRPYHHPSPDYHRYPDSTFSYSSPFKSYTPPVAQYHYSGHHPAINSVTPVANVPYQAPFLQQMFSSTASFNPISYFMNRNRPPTVNPLAPKPLGYYPRQPVAAAAGPSPFYDFKPSETHPYPKKAVYYGQPPAGHEFNPLVHRPSYKDAMNAAYSVQSQKYLPYQQMAQSVPLVHHHQHPHQSPYYQPFTPQSAPHFTPQAAAAAAAASAVAPGQLSPFHQLSNPFVVQHMQMIPFEEQQQQQQQSQQPQNNPYQQQQQFITHLTIPVSGVTSSYRFPPSIPLHDPDSPPSTTTEKPTSTTTPSSSQRTTTHGRNIFEIAREPKQRSKFSDPDPLYHGNAKEISATISTLLNKLQASPKVSYFFPKEHDDNSFKPLFPLVPASTTARRNFSEADFKHLLLQGTAPHQHHHPQFQKVNSFFVTSGKGNIIYATPSSLPLQGNVQGNNKKPSSNIIYGQPKENKVPPPTPRPDFLKESPTKSQLPAPSKGTNQPPAVVSSPSPKTTKKTTVATTTKRVTPVNLITPPSSTSTSTTTTTTTQAAPLTTASRTTTSTTATTARSTTTRATMEPPTTVLTQRTPRGRQYSRSKVTTTTTEKPVLKWMPKRKRPKQETPKIAATLNNAGTTLPRPHISNRTRISAQASSNRPIIIPLDDVSMGPEEAHFQRRHEKYIQATGSPSFVERNGITTSVPARNNRKRKNHARVEYSNFVTVPTTTTTIATTTKVTTEKPAVVLFQGEESIPEPQRNVFTTTPSAPVTSTSTTPVNIPTFTSRTMPVTTPVPESVVQTLERDVYTTSAMPHFLPTIPPSEAAIPVVPLELFELSKAAPVMKTLESDTPDVELFRTRDEDDDDDDEEEGDNHDDDGNDSDDEREDDDDNDTDDDEEEEDAESGLNFIAKSIVAHAKKVFSDASTNEVDAEEAGKDQQQPQVDASEKKVEKREDIVEVQHVGAADEVEED